MTSWKPLPRRWALVTTGFAVCLAQAAPPHDADAQAVDAPASTPLGPREVPAQAGGHDLQVSNPFVQYGVAFSTEFVASSNALCSGNASVAPHCVLGSGAGFVFPRVGWRSPGHWYVGGAYEFSKQDASTLYLLPILQQLRGEGRYYFLEGNVLTPFLEGGLGIAGYGNEWTVDSYGPAASLAMGLEAQLSRNTVVGATLAYRLIHFSEFKDSAGNDRSAGAAQLVGVNIHLEVRDPY